jgi:peroxiredoxin
MNLGAPGDNYDIYKMVVDSLEKSYPKNKWVTNIKQTISSMKATAIGATAPDFTINDVNGNPFTLSSLRGSYVFIDFWASWCKPCRDENPNLVRMYNKYKDKDFEIVGISLDDTIKNSNGKEKWINAIQQDNIKWIQLSELNGNESITSKLYNISSIPATFLIDKEGKIIAKDIRGTQLNKTLSEIF